MKVKWLGHACFLITAEDGTRIITDPYDTSEGLKYGKINESADIVTCSHDHSDHNNVTAVQGIPQMVKEPGIYKGINIKTIKTAHDDKSGSERGINTVFCFEVDRVRICHLGDLGHLLTDNQVVEIGKVHVLLIPVGGHFTINAKDATRVAEQVRARTIIPMHYKNDKCVFPIGGIEEFTKNKTNVIILDGTEMEFKMGEMSNEIRVIVLKAAL